MELQRASGQRAEQILGQLDALQQAAIADHAPHLLGPDEFVGRVHQLALAQFHVPQTVAGRFAQQVEAGLQALVGIAQGGQFDACCTARAPRQAEALAQARTERVPGSFRKRTHWSPRDGLVGGWAEAGSMNAASRIVSVQLAQH